MNSKRYKHLVEEFERVHGRKPEFIVRSPGRVNLIGEHIDYCGFGVLPMAIERDVVIAGAVTEEDTKVRIANVNDKKYPAREFDYEGKEKVITIDSTKLEWSNYFKCGYKVFFFKKEGIQTHVIYRECSKNSNWTSPKVFTCLLMVQFLLAVDFLLQLPLSVLQLLL